MSSEHVRVGTLAEVPEGEIRAFDLPTGRVGVAHDGTFDDRSSQLTCSECDSVFDLETGEPIEGPARDPLPLYSAREDDGWIEVSVTPIG